MNRNEKIIVIGGNAAGPAAAAKAKRVNPDAEVLMFESGEFISTGTCEIPYVLSGEIKSETLIVNFTPDSFFKEKGVKVFIKHKVISIDSLDKTIIAKNLIDETEKQFVYDKLIISTGSSAKTLPDINCSYDNVFTLKSVKDLQMVLEKVGERKTNSVVIIGSGFLGLEASEALNKIGFDVNLIEKEDKPLPLAEKEIRNFIQSELNKNGISFYGGVENLERRVEGNKITQIKFKGLNVNPDFIILAIGFKPNTALAESAGIDLGKLGGIKIINRCQTSKQNIYAAGDCVELTNFVTNKPEYLPLATLAHLTGHTAGENAAGGNSILHPFIANISAKIFDKFFASAGITTKMAYENNLNYLAVDAKSSNLVKVMPASKNVYGKIVFSKQNHNILGGSFFGGNEVSGYSDLISAMVHNKTDVRKLAKYFYNYTPPLSPFINLLSILGRKAEEKLG